MSEKLSERMREYLKNKSFQSRPVECFIDDFIVEAQTLEQKLAEAEKQNRLMNCTISACSVDILHLTDRLAERDALIDEMRMALENCVNGLGCQPGYVSTLALERARRVLAVTPAAALVEHDRELLERAAKVSDYYAHYSCYDASAVIARDISAAIRALKPAAAPEPAAPDGALTEGGAR